MNLERIAAIANLHNAAAANVKRIGRDGALVLSAEENEEIAQVCLWYMSAVEREGILRDKFAGLAMQGLLAGASVDAGNIISGPQIAATAYDIATCMMEVRAAQPVCL